ncbi:type III-A CRISPR-associated RAMP protein Csm4 [Fibrisoma montanum]|uniref:CRISPR system Cms protein Csm4 n=1 Tax=Fibrisoma montanum TaxID=2305895 RepID=A0A418MFM9_9BACT|nr:type III-A CRISPR-associated RAMP protein Csm4 [Fibrisoma montanum]RIV25581.1 type III-A CRISPR-associated RAMP protein Csm4 [Fibrisoma montanum]
MAKRTYQILKLHFRSPLHLSKGKTDDYGESEEVLHADTLKSALYVCARQVFGAEAIGDTDSFFRKFRISSAFPFVGNELFFPKPQARIQGFSTAEVAEERQAKKHKKLAFLGQSYFEDLINERQRELRKNDFTTDGRFVSDHADVRALGDIPVFATDVQQRVTIPANYEDDPLPYYVDRLFFSDTAGLWFAYENVEGDDDTYTKMLAALRFLGDSGVGTDRSVGNGQFDVSETTLTLRVPDEPTHELLLSLYCPEQTELDAGLLQDSAYGLIKRGGYLASPDRPEHLTYRKKSIYMFTEGSVFPHRADKPLRGKIADLKPDAPEVTQHVWRDGLALTIPITLFPADA